MEEILKKYGISKQLFLKVTQFIKLQVDQNIVHTLTDQKQIAAEILIMASEGMNVKTGEKQCNLPVVMPSYLRERRQALNMSMQDVTNQTNISKATISRLELGNDAYYNHLITLHQFYSDNGV